MPEIAKHRAHFQALSNKAYFNYGGQGTMPGEALEALTASYQYVQTKGPFSGHMFEWLRSEALATKEVLAKELGAESDCMALTHNVTEGCNIAMWGMPWQPGDHLLLSDSEHSGVIAIAEVLAKRLHLELTYFKAGLPEDDVLSNLDSSIGPKTKLVVVSHVLWNTGRILPIKDMQQLCRKKGVRMLVDGAQSAGMLPIDVKSSDVDFYALTGHKWLCGPEGIGAFYCRKELLNELLPTYVGWRPEMVSPDKPNAARFEVATSPFPLLSGLRAAMEVHRQWGTTEECFNRIKGNAEYLRKHLLEIPGVKIWNEPNQYCGLTSFSFANHNHLHIVKALEQESVLLRTIPKPDCLRASVHYFTTEQEIDRLIDTLQSALKANS